MGMHWLHCTKTTHHTDVQACYLLTLLLSLSKAVNKYLFTYVCMCLSKFTISGIFSELYVCGLDLVQINLLIHSCCLAAVLNLLLLTHIPANKPATNVSAPMRRDTTTDTPVHREMEQDLTTLSLRDTV